MEISEILYIIIASSVVVLTVTIVWLSNEAIGLIKSIRRSSDDVETMTREIKEKVLLVSESMDRAGTAASNIIGLVEDAIEGIKERRDQLADTIGLVTGVGDYFKNKKKSKSKEEAVEGEKPEVDLEKEADNLEENSEKKSKKTATKK